MDIKVSVVIPVFNAESYLAECIESLLGQTLQECEFILVNDGSSDGSGSIIESYRQADSRIQSIQQENKGVSAARNAGLLAARGKYIGFADADDYIEPDMYETLYAAAQERGCDAVLSNFESELEGRRLVTAYPFQADAVLDRRFITGQIMPYFLKADNLNTVVNKLYRAALITEHQIRFPEKMALGEDGMFNMLYFSHAASMIYLDYTGYHYREVSGSATRNIRDQDYFRKAIEIYIGEPPAAYKEIVSVRMVKRLKAIRLISSLISYIYIYLKPSKDMSFKDRYRYVKRMITNPYVREALPDYWSEMNGSIGRYERFILNMVKARSMPGLLCAVMYSRMRNGQHTAS